MSSAMSSSTLSLGLSQSDVTNPNGDANATSVGATSAVSVASSGSSDAFGLGAGQSEAHAPTGDAHAAAAGHGDALALTGNGDATAIGIGIGQSEAHAPTGQAGSSSLGIGSATAVTGHGTADATGVGIAQSTAHSGDTIADDQAFGIGHAQASGAGSTAVGAGAGEVVDIAQPFHGVPGEFGSIDLSGFTSGHGCVGSNSPGASGSGMTDDPRMGAIVTSFEATAHILSNLAHAYLQYGGSPMNATFNIAGGTFTLHGDGGTDLAHGDATREASITFNQQFDLGNGRSVSLAYAFAEEDNLASGKSQIATGFGFAAGNDAHAFATADAGSAGANSLDFASPLHQADAFAYA